MTELDKLKAQYETCKSLDTSKQTPIKVEIVRNTNQLIDEALDYVNAASAAGVDSTRLRDLIGRGEAFKDQVLQDTMGTGSSASRLSAVN